MEQERWLMDGCGRDGGGSGGSGNTDDRLEIVNTKCWYIRATEFITSVIIK